MGPYVAPVLAAVALHAAFAAAYAAAFGGDASAFVCARPSESGRGRSRP